MPRMALRTRTDAPVRVRLARRRCDAVTIELVEHVIAIHIDTEQVAGLTLRAGSRASRHLRDVIELDVTGIRIDAIALHHA